MTAGEDHHFSNINVDKPFKEVSDKEIEKLTTEMKLGCWLVKSNELNARDEPFAF